MSRPARLPHELRLRNHHGRVVCTYRIVVYPFGTWGANGPTPDALGVFHRQVGVWTLNPDAGSRDLTGEPLAILWADWLESPHSPRDRRDENRRCGRAMFGSIDQPGPLLGAPVADLAAADVLAWQDRFCAANLSRYTVKRFVALLRSCLAWGHVAAVLSES